MNRQKGIKIQNERENYRSAMITAYNYNINLAILKSSTKGVKAEPIDIFDLYNFEYIQKPKKHEQSQDEIKENCKLFCKMMGGEIK